jgi:hypothetical protein
MFSKIVSFAMAIASRGLKDAKIDLPTKQLRYISCFGNEEISKCPKIQKSKSSNFYYCGGCGCGDHPHTWLQRENDEYSKLDYPHLDCPLKMPGFSNYDPASPSESLQRKRQIENMDPEKLQYVNITLSVDPEKQKIFEKISNVIKNS